MSSASSTRGRVRRACRPCALRKQKCESIRPCTRCIKANRIEQCFDSRLGDQPTRAATRNFGIHSRNSLIDRMLDSSDFEKTLIIPDEISLGTNTISGSTMPSTNSYSTTSCVSGMLPETSTLSSSAPWRGTAGSLDIIGNDYDDSFGCFNSLSERHTFQSFGLKRKFPAGERVELTASRKDRLREVSFPYPERMIKQHAKPVLSDSIDLTISSRNAVCSVQSGTYASSRSIRNTSPATRFRPSEALQVTARNASGVIDHRSASQTVGQDNLQASSKSMDLPFPLRSFLEVQSDSSSRSSDASPIDREGSPTCEEPQVNWRKPQDALL
eukprot:gb/GECG01000941.1/.p1 GENE.gb/GECG01000941.1/~~gb/GECG01000941.1/.p1  ORF type:complete len:328 (+),score=17.62 gb/GECG01000941.1/:1-984(+)